MNSVDDNAQYQTFVFCTLHANLACFLALSQNKHVVTMPLTGLCKRKFGNYESGE